MASVTGRGPRSLSQTRPASHRAGATAPAKAMIFSGLQAPDLSRRNSMAPISRCALYRNAQSDQRNLLARFRETAISIRSRRRAALPLTDGPVAGRVRAQLSELMELRCATLLA